LSGAEDVGRGALARPGRAELGSFHSYAFVSFAVNEPGLHHQGYEGARMEQESG
jgi:hypothetical protein